MQLIWTAKVETLQYIDPFQCNLILNGLEILLSLIRELIDGYHSFNKILAGSVAKQESSIVNIESTHMLTFVGFISFVELLTLKKVLVKN